MQYGLGAGDATGPNRAMPDEELIEAKAALRKAGLAAARASAAALGAEAGLRVRDLALKALPLAGLPTVAAYAPFHSEIDPMPLLGALAARGQAIALPVVDAPGQPLRFRRWRPGEALIAGQFGAREPRAAAPELHPQIVLVPLVAFDGAGYRLGRGGGFYDRTLSALRAAGPCVAAGLGFSAQRVAHVPREAHDQRLDYVITEDGALRFAP